MDNNNPNLNQTPQQPQVPPQPAASFIPPQNIPSANNMMPEHHEHKSVGPIVGSLIIVILLVGAAVYIWGQKLNNEEKYGTVPPGDNPAAGTYEAGSADADKPDADLSGTSSADTSIESQLEADLEGLDDMNF